VRAAPAEVLLEERTAPGLHDFLVREVLSRYAPGARVVDLGAGSGALARRLADMGAEVTACDRAPVRAGPGVRFVPLDLDRPAFSEVVGRRVWDVVAAVEVIEHLEAPLAFLRQVAALLAPGGVAVLTTPNLGSLPARCRFALKGSLRQFDGWGDPTHISPIFWPLLEERYLPEAGLGVVQHLFYPPRGFVVGRPLYRRALRPWGRMLAASGLAGDVHVLVLGRHR
jgi:SAM-dependent methyltransferase